MGRRRTILDRFGQAVRDRREALELTQEGLAHRSGLDRTYISGIERGQRNLSLLNIERLARALDVTIPELFADV